MWREFGRHRFPLSGRRVFAMRTIWVLGATVLLATVATPVAAGAPWDPNGVGLSADHTADCSGITIVTEGWPDGSTGVLGINGVGYTIPMGGATALTGTWTTAGTYSYAIRFTVPGQVPSAEGATIVCETPVAEVDALLTLPATL